MDNYVQHCTNKNSRSVFSYSLHSNFSDAIFMFQQSVVLVLKIDLTFVPYILQKAVTSQKYFSIR